MMKLCVFFIRYKDFWDNGEPTAEQVDKIYKRRNREKLNIYAFSKTVKKSSISWIITAILIQPILFLLFSCFG